MNANALAKIWQICATNVHVTSPLKKIGTVDAMK
jgi:hypothetical protein